MRYTIGIKIKSLSTYFNMASRTFKITYESHIMFLLDGANLGHIKSQKVIQLCCIHAWQSHFTTSAQSS